MLSSILIPFTLAASTLAQISTSNTACTKHYVVQDGDTCDRIGQKTFTSTSQVMSLNLPEAGSSCYDLEVGVQLCLGTYGNDCQLVHRATDSDTCNSIASTYNISISTLKTNNAMLECSQVYSGLMLCVSQGIIRPPADPSLNVSYDPFSPGYTDANATLPLGTAVVATNAAEVGPVVTQVVTVIASASSTTTSTSLSTVSSSTGSKSSSSTSTIKTASTVKDNAKSSNQGHHQGRRAHAGNHQAAAKRYQESHTEASP